MLVCSHWLTIRPTSENSRKFAEANSHYNQAVELRYQHNYQRAADEFEAALQLAPDWPDAMEDLAEIYCYNLPSPDHVAMAVQLFTRVIAQQSENAKAYYNRANAYRQLGDNEQASADFQSVIRYATDPQLRAGAARNLSTLGGTAKGGLGYWYWGVALSCLGALTFRHLSDEKDSFYLMCSSDYRRMFSYCAAKTKAYLLARRG
ncbi:MAG TPA: tetratricopeptide repeat protein [Chthonomonadaceae bacterium]|nr:tetratricopeptide repeat protein [Chthonomonadaceae bacterium]